LTFRQRLALRSTCAVSTPPSITATTTVRAGWRPASSSRSARSDARPRPGRPRGRGAASRARPRAGRRWARPGPRARGAAWPGRWARRAP
jgi:hypothetical protein